METTNVMKKILSLVISAALIVSGYAQTRNVLVGTNNAVVQPTNFWSADASNARTGLGLGTAATSNSSAFQPSSLALSNLASSNAVNLTNLRATNVVGTLSLAQGGTGSTNAADARTAFGLGTAATNLASAFQPSSTVLSNLASNNAADLTNVRATNIVGSSFSLTSSVLSNLALNNGGALTNIPLAGVVGALATNGSAAGLTNFPTVPLASNVTGTIAISNGGSGATTAGGARTNLGLEWSALTNSNAATSLLGVATNGQVVANTGTNQLTFTNAFAIRDANSGKNLDFIFTDEALNAGYGDSDYAIGVGDYGVAIKYGAAGSDWGQPILFQEGSGNVVFPSATLEFIQPLAWNNTTNASATRANLGFSTNLNTFWTATNSSNARSAVGLGWSALTNSNAGTGLVSVNTNGEVVSPTNFWQVAPISTTVQYQTNVTGTSTNAATNSRNLFLFSLAPSVSGVTNTVTLPTNPATTFEGDRATITHLAQTNTAVTAIRQLGAATNLITLNQLDETILLMYRGGAWRLADNISYIEPIYFSGTNAAANAAASRTNLGLGSANSVEFAQVVVIDNDLTTALYGEGGIIFEADGTNYSSIFTFGGDESASLQARARTNLNLGATWLTNTNVTNFRTAIGLGAGNNVTFNNVSANNDVFVANLAGNGDTAPIAVDDNGALVYVGSSATYRSRIGLPLPALTNTNNANFQAAVFATNAAPTNSANVNGIGFNTAVAWMEVTVSTNGTNHSFRIPLFR